MPSAATLAASREFSLAHGEAFISGLERLVVAAVNRCFPVQCLLPRAVSLASFVNFESLFFCAHVYVRVRSQGWATDVVFIEEVNARVSVI